MCPYPAPAARFDHVNLDLVGPLPPSEGHTYLLTMIDRFSRWVEAIPISNMSASTCAEAFIRHWISRFGVPLAVTTDRGAQFTSALWQELQRVLGVASMHTTAYHPQSNGMIERFHRTLKERLMARAQSDPAWTQHLPLVLLGVRTSLREDSGTSPAELLYGAHLRLPGDFVSGPSSSFSASPSEFVALLRDRLAASAPMPTEYHGHSAVHLPSSLASATAVYLRVDAVRKPLVPPYEGPFQVLQRNAKTFTICRSGKPVVVSVDRLKVASVSHFKDCVSPAFKSVPKTPSTVSPAASSTPASPSSSDALGRVSPAPVRTSRAGRVLRPPVRWDPAS